MNTYSIPQTISANGKLLDFSTCRIMGIINATPDSFYSGSRRETLANAQNEITQMIEAGADIIDIGGMSTRPYAKEISANEEWERIVHILQWCRKTFPNIFISVDTYRSEIAQKAIDLGADIINDISAGTKDQQILKVMAQSQLPYIAMHMQGNPQNMQDHPEYDDVVKDIMDYFILKKQVFNEAGVFHVIIDPGFGFGKTIAHNYQLLNQLGDFRILDLPILVGMSRKGMIWKTLASTPEDALYGSIAAQSIAVLKGADILRVHDVKAAADTINPTW